MFAIHIKDNHSRLRSSCHSPIAIGKSSNPKPNTLFIMGGLMWPVGYERLLVAGRHREQPPATICHTENLPGPMLELAYTCHKISAMNSLGCNRGFSLL